MTDLKRAVKSSLGAIAGALGLYSHNFRSRMFIVAFHRVSDHLEEDGLTCKAEKFDAFCGFFKRYFRVVSFEEQVLACSRGIDMGGTLSITFDDGYRDNFEVAAPILKKHQLPATFFITTGFIGTQKVPFWDKDLVAWPGWMSWEQVRSLAAQGFSIGAHTDTHINMALTSPEEIKAELILSKQKLEAQLESAVNLFAYPFGGREHISSGAIELVKEAGFISCASCHGGTNQPIDDPFNLKRIGIAGWFTTPNQFGTEILMRRV